MLYMIRQIIITNNSRGFKCSVTKGQLTIYEMPIILSYNEPTDSRPSLNPRGNQGKGLQSYWPNNEYRQ